MFKKIPVKEENFRFRDKELFQLLELMLVKHNRIVALTGVRGIGKSSLAKFVLHYTAERKMFTGGILFVKVQGTTQTFLVMKMIMREIIKFLDLTQEQKI